MHQNLLGVTLSLAADARGTWGLQVTVCGHLFVADSLAAH